MNSFEKKSRMNSSVAANEPGRLTPKQVLKNPRNLNPTKSNQSLKAKVDNLAGLDSKINAGDTQSESSQQGQSLPNREAGTKSQKNRPESILVVDDDALVRDIVVSYLKELGFSSVDSAVGGGQAQEKLADPNYKVDLVITDWEMPGINGIMLLKLIRKNPKRENLKVMVMTSQQPTEKFKIKQAAQWAVNAYLIKPFRGNVLKEKLQEVLDA